MNNLIYLKKKVVMAIYGKLLTQTQKNISH